MFYISNQRFWNTYTKRYSDNSPRIHVEIHYAILFVLEIFQISDYKIRHNVSLFSNENSGRSCPHPLQR